LRDAQLDVGEDEGTVEFDGLLVVSRGVGELTEDEVQLSSMVVDVGIVFVLRGRLLEVIGSGFSVAFDRLAAQSPVAF
jgi:hypothetical protein